MNPDKLKKIAFCALGLWVVLAGVLGWLAFSSASERSEAEEKLEEETSDFRKFNDAAVFPSVASIASVKSNEIAWAAWYDAAFVLAGRATKDYKSNPPSPPAFKQQLQTTVRSLQSLPGGAEGKLSQPTFFFGFEKYLGDAAILPVEADIPVLCAQLDSIAEIAGILSDAGANEVKSVVREPVKEDDGECARHLDYTFTFSARPAAIVKAVNSIAAAESFAAVSAFSFRETADSITPRLSADRQTKKKETGGRRGRGRGRGAAVEENADGVPDESRKENRLVTDPSVNAMFDVTMTVKVYDFSEQPEESSAGKKKGKKGGR